MLRANQRPPSVLGADDPFTQAMRPPEFETDGERHARLEQEAAAKRTSDLIDEEIRRDKEKFKRSKQDVKVASLSASIHFSSNGVPSCSCWAKQSLASRHYRNNSSCSTRQHLWSLSAHLGKSSSYSMSHDQSAESWKHSTHGGTSLKKRVQQLGPLRPRAIMHHLPRRLLLSEPRNFACACLLLWLRRLYLQSVSAAV